MYRFLLTPKWLGFGLLMLVMSVVMIGLSDWQWHRYELHHGINVRIAQAQAAAPVPMDSVVAPNRPLPSAQEWVRVTVSGTYAPDKTVIARERTVNDTIGFEIITPLVLPDGSAVLVDRGFLSGDSGGSHTLPDIPAVPSGTVTIVGRVHLPESEPDHPTVIDGKETVRRIAPSSVASYLGYASLYPDYVLADSQTPSAAGNFTTIPADTQPAWMNAGYTIQWAGFALIPILGFVWQARKDARDRLAAGSTGNVPLAPGEAAAPGQLVAEDLAALPDRIVATDRAVAKARATSDRRAAKPRPAGKDRVRSKDHVTIKDRVAAADLAAAERLAAERAAAAARVAVADRTPEA